MSRHVGEIKECTNPFVEEGNCNKIASTVQIPWTANCRHNLCAGEDTESLTAFRTTILVDLHTTCLTLGVL